MNTNGEKLLLRDEVFQVVARAIEVFNGVGHGLIEKPYENALVIKFSLRNELSANHRLACWSDRQFQTPQTGVGADCLMNSCLFVSIRG